MRNFAALLLLAAVAQPATAQLTASPAQLTFPAAYVGIQSPVQSVTLSNTSGAPMYIDRLFTSIPTAAGDFVITGTTCPTFFGTNPVALPPGANCAVSIQFAPAVVGADSGSLTVNWRTDLTVPGSLTLTVPLSGAGLFPLKLSTSQLNFGDVLVNTQPAFQTMTVTNLGGSQLVVTSTSSNPAFLTGACDSLAAGASCTFYVAFSPAVAGPQSGTASVFAALLSNTSRVFGPATIALSGSGHSIYVQPSLTFPMILLGSPPQTAYAAIANFASAPATISRIVVSGSAFSADVSACIGTLAAGPHLEGSTCYFPVTFSPTIAKESTGSLTVYDDDPSSPQVIPLSGSATAMKLTGPNASSSEGAWFDPQRLLTASAAQSFRLTNTGGTRLKLGDVTVGQGFGRSTDCKTWLDAGASCSIAVTFEPVADGFSSENLTLTASDPASPMQAPLNGTGIGIGNRMIRVHYDYMVASDHTHDPEVTSPGAIDRIVRTFALHGVQLIVDPHHAAIPEVPVMTFQPGNAGLECMPGAVNFYSLRNQYFSPKWPGEHYAIFGHSMANTDSRCFPGGSGFAELPGLNFVVTLGGLSSSFVLSSAVAGTFMHELGHNLGLHHGGGFGGGDSSTCDPRGCYDTDPINYKPNYLSVMNYDFQFYGVPQANAVGSTNPSQCSADRDCGLGQYCVIYSSNGSTNRGTCYRQDYSTQELPTGGNTPGALDERDLDETAGLGSWTNDITSFWGSHSPGAFATRIPTTGPVDWNYDGAADQRHLAWDIDLGWDFETGDFSTPKLLKGHDDWGAMLATRPLRRSAATASVKGERELDVETAAAHHVLFPLRPAPLTIPPRCKTQSTFTVALLATEDFDPNEVDLTSVDFHGAHPTSSAYRDVNGDGVPDLALEFHGSEVHLSKDSRRARLTGWLKNSQSFAGEAEVCSN